jgi:hypothetical protein
MGFPDIRNFLHTPCRFRLRSGREVYGVIWEVSLKDENRLCFASIGDYERLRRDPLQSIQAIPLLPDEIMIAERLAG